MLFSLHILVVEYVHLSLSFHQKDCISIFCYLFPMIWSFTFSDKEKLYLKAKLLTS